MSLHKGANMIKKNIIAAISFIIISIAGIMPAICAVDTVDTVDALNNSKPKSEIKHVLKKFAVSMSLVGGCCIILYFALKTYKRFKEKEETVETCHIDVSKDLATPETIDSATKLFIEKF